MSDLPAGWKLDPEPEAPPPEGLPGGWALDPEPAAEAAAPAPPPGPTVSLTESALRGAGQGASFGFSDEAEALLASLFPTGYQGPRAAARGMGAPLDERSAYQRHLEEARKQYAQAQAANPLAYGAGEIGGALVSGGGAAGAGGKLAARMAPGLVAQLAAADAAAAGTLGRVSPTLGRIATQLGPATASAGGAALGALEGAGRTEHELLSAEGAQDVGREALLGGTLAPTLGMAIPAAVEGGKALAGRVAGRLGGLAEGLETTANRVRVGAAGGSQNLRDVRRIDRMAGGVEGFGADLKELGIGTGIPSTGQRSRLPQTVDTYAADAAAVQQQAGQKIRDLTAQATREGVEVDGTDIGLRLLSNVGEQFKGLPGSQASYEAIERLANEWADKGRMSYDQAHQLRVKFDRLTDWNSMGGAATLKREMRGEIQGALMDALETASPELREQLADANRRYAVSATVSDMAEEQARRESRNLPLGLTEMLGGGTGAAIGAADSALSGGLGSMAGVAAAKYLKPRQHDIAARMLDAASGAARGVAQRFAPTERAASILQSTPEAYGRFAPALSQALQRGQEAFAAAHYVLSAQTPEFRELERDLAERAEQQQETLP